MARKLSTSYTPAELKKFRHGISILKKKGIVSNVDARTARPEMIRGGKTLLEQSRKFDDVISGKAEAVKLPQKKLREYKKAGYETQQGRVMVPKLANDKVTIEKGEIKIVDKKSGLERIKKAVPYEKLSQWLTDMKANHLRIDAMKRRNEWFAYKIAGHTSWNLYRDIDLMLHEMENGTTSGLNLSEKIRHDSRKQQNEFFEALEIVRVPRAEAWPSPPQRKRGGPQSKKSRKAWLKRIANTEKGEEMRRKNAARMREWRKNLKGKALKEYKKDGAKRAKKSRRKKK